jgi:polysaccharide chain length determinant protein (PEP-CTERM system associated)
MNAALDFIFEQIRGVWRFRWIAMLVAWVVCLIGWFLVLLIPDTYAAWARVYVDTRTRLSQVTAPLGTGSNMASSLEMVRSTLLGGPQLEKVAKLAIPSYATASQVKQQEIINGLRERLTVEASTDKGASADLYLISYTDHDALNAHHVVDQLLNLFMSNTFGDTQLGSEQAQTFLKQQIAEYDRKLEAAEGRLADFKRQHPGLVPGANGGDYFSRLQAESENLNKDRLALTVAEQKRDELRRQLSSEQQVGAVSVSGGASGTTTGSAIREAQNRLDELLLRYTDKHPDVIAARQALVDLRQRQAAEIAAVRRGDQAAIAATGLDANPVYQGIRLQLSQVDAEAAAAGQQVHDEEARIDELRKMINTAPAVEAEFTRLNRDYDVTRGEYQALVDRLNRAKLSDQADATGLVRFKIVDPPTGSDHPVSPDRVRLILTVLLGGFVAGIAVAYFMHQLRPVFTSTRQLSELTQLPVLGAVSMTWLERHKTEGRRAIWAYSAVAGILVVVALITLSTQGWAVRILHGSIA